MTAKILLVEDSATNRYLATYLLGQHGFEVVHAENGLEAIDAAERERPDLILMDIQMPKMDGYEAAMRIRETPELSAIPLVALTSFAMDSDRAKAFASGFVGHIEKPISPDTFISQISQHLSPNSGTS